MAIADIITEIDTYLSCLRRARAILSASIPGQRSEKTIRRKEKAKAGKAAPFVSNVFRLREKKSGSNKLLPQGMMTVEKRVNSEFQAPGLAAPEVAMPEQPPTLELQTQRIVEIEKLPSRGGRRSILPAQRRTMPRKLDPKPNQITPAIALAGSMSSRIVVVSAEEAKRERNRPVDPEVQPRRVPTGLTGKLAFEALFKD
jgi:hypothetical protein